MEPTPLTKRTDRPPTETPSTKRAPTDKPSAGSRSSGSRASATGPEPGNGSWPDAKGPLLFPEPRLTVAAWHDPVLDHLGHDPRSRYAERFWLPIVGPSCLLLGRRLAAELEQQPEGFELISAVWAAELGLGVRGGRHGPFWRSLDRACRFGLAKRNGASLMARLRLPPLSARQAQRLPTSLQAAHEQWQNTGMEQPRRPTLVAWHPPADAA